MKNQKNFLKMNLLVNFMAQLSLFVVVMCVRHQLSQTDSVRIVTLLQEGHTQRQVAEHMGVAQSVVSRAWTRFRETGQHQRRPGQGRRRCTTAHDDRYLTMLALRNRQTTSVGLQIQLQQGTGVRVSSQTVRNRLREAQLTCRIPVRAPQLTVDHRRMRVNFAQEHTLWNLRDWSCVLFTDESRFTVSTSDRRVRVWRRQGERYAECNVVRFDNFGGGSVMVWGGISVNGRTDLHVFRGGTVTAVRYIQEILEPIVRPYAGAVGDNFILMHDNARPPYSQDDQGIP